VVLLEKCGHTMWCLSKNLLKSANNKPLKTVFSLDRTAPHLLLEPKWGKVAQKGIMGKKLGFHG